MDLWGRVQGDDLAETTGSDPTGHYAPGLVWVNLSAVSPQPQRGWTATQTPSGGWTFAPPTGPTSAEVTRSALAALVSHAYDLQTAGVLFQASGAATPSLFATDPDSTGRMTAAFVMAGAGLWVDGTPWRTASGGYVPLTKGDVLALATGAAGYVARVTVCEAELAAAIAANPATDITVGWPSNQVTTTAKPAADAVVFDTLNAFEL